MHTVNTHWKFYVYLHAYSEHTLEVLHRSACIQLHAHCVGGTKREKPKGVRFWFKILAGNLCLKITESYKSEELKWYK